MEMGTSNSLVEEEELPIISTEVVIPVVTCASSTNIHSSLINLDDAVSAPITPSDMSHGSSPSLASTEAIAGSVTEQGDELPLDLTTADQNICKTARETNFTDFDSAASANQTNGSGNVPVLESELPATTADEITPGPSTRSPRTGYSLRTRKESNEDVPFVGLINQGATCYLNCLLQALYMTPEFRDIVWGWNATDLAEGTVCYELQQVFIGLKTSQKTAVETRNLTKSFGWPENELYEQQDIQELWRILFESLEGSLKGDDLAKLRELYEGEMLDYVKCKECCTVSSRPVAFQDVSLPLRAFGATAVYKNIEEALDAFVAVESLTGDNQYSCEKCSKKCDACKGLTFRKFPGILAFQLKRFEFKENLRGKLNDSIVFPEYFDLDKYIEKGTMSEDQGSPDDKDSKIQIDGAAGDTIKVPEKPQRKKSAEKQDENPEIKITAIVNSNGTNDNAEPSINNYYELYAVLIHSGVGLRGGHYYAFIKSLETSVWFKFDDRTVSTMPKKQLSEAYGGTSSTSAYMLIYRRVDGNSSSAVKQLVESSQLPPHLETKGSEATQGSGSKRNGRRTVMSTADFDMFKLRIWYRSPECAEYFSTEHYNSSYIHLYVTSDTTVGELKQRATERLKLKQPELYRIIKMHSDTARVEYSLDNESQLLVNVLDAEEKNPSLVLNSRLPDAQFIEFPIDSIHPNIIRLEFPSPALNAVIRDVREVVVSFSATIASLKESISKTFLLESTNLILVVDNVGEQPLVLENNAQVLEELNCGPQTRFYFAEETQGVCVMTAISNWVNVLQDTVQIYAVLPPISYVSQIYKKKEDILKNTGEPETEKKNGQVTAEKFFSCLDSNDQDTFRRVLLTINVKETWGWLQEKIATLLDCEYDNLRLSTMDLIGSYEENDIKDQLNYIFVHLKMHEQTLSYYPNVELHVLPQNDSVLETRGKVQLLDTADDAQPLSLAVHVRVGRTSTIGFLKKLAIEVFAKTYQKNLAFDMCRLRKLSLNMYVSDVIKDKDHLLDHVNPGSLWLLCIQEVSSGDKLFAKTIQGCFIFVRRYFPATDTVGNTVELYLAKWCPKSSSFKDANIICVMLVAQSLASTSEEFVAKLVATAALPAEQLIAYVCGRNYPVELSGYAKHSIRDWAKLSDVEQMHKLWDSQVYGDGHLVYYMDNAELIQQSQSNDHGQCAPSAEDMQRRMVRVEKPLRIMQERPTTPGPTDPSTETESAT